MTETAQGVIGVAKVFTDDGPVVAITIDGQPQIYLGAQVASNLSLLLSQTALWAAIHADDWRDARLQPNLN